MKINKNVAFAAFLAVAVALAAFAPGAPVQAQVGGQMYIAINDNSYSNPFVTLPVGTTVTWTNTGNNQHAVVANDGSFDSGTLSRNQTFTRTFNTAGTFSYYDRFYGGPNTGMYGTIVIGSGGNTTYPVCSPSTQFVNSGNSATLTATGGNGVYSWYAAGASPSSGSGSTFTAAFYASGPQTVSVTSNGSTAQCTVNVNTTVNPPLPPIGGAPVCSPSTQSASIGNRVTFTATGGNGSYTWSSPGLVITNPTGSSFTATFNTAGVHSVTVSSNGQTSVCTVSVTGSVLGVSDISTGPEDVALWAAILGLLAAGAAYAVIARKRLV